MPQENPLIGKIIKRIFLAEDKQALKFIVLRADLLEDEIIVLVDGDCCSYSWVENIENPEAAVGSPVILAEGIDMPDLGGSDPDEYEVIQYYGFKIRTVKGDCIIDYRNSSNGYYGGNLVWPDEYHYGGVHGQNQSKYDWKLVAEV